MLELIHASNTTYRLLTTCRLVFFDFAGTDDDVTSSHNGAVEAFRRGGVYSQRGFIIPCVHDEDSSVGSDMLDDLVDWRRSRGMTTIT